MFLPRAFPGVTIANDSFFLSLSMVGMAEMFDKTWFVALVMALRHEKVIVFWGCFAALVVHVFISAACGYSIAKLCMPSTLNFFAAALYGVFSIMYGYDWYTTEKDADLMASGKEEVSHLANERAAILSKDESYAARMSHVRTVFMKCFMAVFIAEWGDRTQIAMVGLHASHPLLPVILGSSLAFALLTLSAVIVGMLLGERSLSEKAVKAACAVGFVVFTVLAVRDGMMLRHQEMQAASTSSHSAM